ncbi:LLM class flavin-dependent oxidoreductase [Millisia brevis]|uniref:LLM class flavin-dependent oxidoreductase n=1 Tax=Millisia brevis TaxID=264148 RepID=UPI00082F993B|nr:LLM class flavin-dependent oxidoreductase [Millisia brevis]
MTQDRPIHLYLYPDDPSAAVPATLSAVIAQARTAERGRFDAVLAAPVVAGLFEPSTLLPALAVRTTRIGLVAPTSIDHLAPYNVARRISTLDHFSHGRAGWSIPATDELEPSQLHGAPPVRSEEGRWERAAEFRRVLESLWDSWDSEAIVADKESGLYVRSELIRPIGHVGEHFRVAGPFNLPRSPQRRPPLHVRVAGRPAGHFALDHADVALVREPAQAAELATRAARLPRAPRILVDLPVDAARIDRLADHLIRWVDTDGIDGFTVRAGGSLERFVDTVVPDLQRAGRYRSDYDGVTLRDHLALPTHLENVGVPA